MKNREGFVTFADIDDGFSILQSFSLLYLPTIIAVVYSMLWSWVDLDVKRLEPYYQLSQIGGASAERSLLIHYPVDFLAFIPIKAARYRQVPRAYRGTEADELTEDRHWAVFLAGSIMMLVGWGITPLQSGIFAVTRVIKTSTVHVNTISSLAPLASQVDNLRTELMYKTYGVLWLEEDIPAFTTRDVALVPFTLEDKSGSSAKTKWTSQSTAYSTELTCAPAHISPQESNTIKFTDAAGCFSQFQISSTPGVYLQYAGYQFDPLTDVSILASGTTSDLCSRRWQHTFLAIWGLIDHNGSAYDITAQFCETRYYAQDVMTTVWSSNLSVLDYQPIGPRKLVGPEQFNSTNFEYILSSGMSPISGEEDITQNFGLDLQYRVRNDRLESQFTQMVAFALGTTDSTVDQFKDPSIMHQAFEAAHKIIFALAVNQLMYPIPTNSSDSSGIVQSEVQAIVMVRAFALIVEVLLAIVGLSTLSLYLYSFRRAINLKFDPATIADTMALRSSLGSALERFQDIANCDIKRMEAALTNTRYRLLESSGANPQLLEVLENHGGCAEITGTAERTQALNGPASSDAAHITNSRPILPVEMSWSFGFPFMILLFLACLLLVIIRKQIISSGGKCAVSTYRHILIRR